MWAYPNFIPLSPSVLQIMWERLRPFEFHSVHSLFIGRDIRDPRVKGEMLDGMKMQARFEGYEDHAILREEWDDSGVKSIPAVQPLTVPLAASQPPNRIELERGF